MITRIWNHIAIQAVTKRYDTDYEALINDNSRFFEIMTLSNEKQLSGAIHLKVKSAKPNPENWFLQQIQDKNHEAIVDKVEGTWFVNDFRDFITERDQPLFYKDWSSIRWEFPIDKVINQDALDLEKDWSQLEPFMGKYLKIRLAYFWVCLPRQYVPSISPPYATENQPCLCLCLGLGQMTLTTPLRFITLHFSHLTLTEALTFILESLLLTKPVGNPTPVQVIGRELNKHPITHYNFNIVHPYLTRNMSQHLMPIRQLNTKHRIR